MKKLTFITVRVSIPNGTIKQQKAVNSFWVYGCVSIPNGTIKQ